jgi:hypothetical protein
MKKWISVSILALSAIFCNLPLSVPKPNDDGTVSTIVAAASASAAVAITPTPAPTWDTSGAPVHEMGSISGKLGYPADSLPPMRVTAFDVRTGQARYIDTVAGQPTYSLALPFGTYHIVAYSIETESFPGGIPGGYTRAVVCGMAPECADHAFVDVVVTSGASLSDINPIDFDAGQGAYPPMP